jgi:hypothetical protein
VSTKFFRIVSLIKLKDSAKVCDLTQRSAGVIAFLAGVLAGCANIVFISASALFKWKIDRQRFSAGCASHHESHLENELPESFDLVADQFRFSLRSLRHSLRPSRFKILGRSVTRSGALPQRTHGFPQSSPRTSIPPNQGVVVESDVVVLSQQALVAFRVRGEIVKATK